MGASWKEAVSMGFWGVGGRGMGGSFYLRRQNIIAVDARERRRRNEAMGEAMGEEEEEENELRALRSQEM